MVCDLILDVGYLFYLVLELKMSYLPWTELLPFHPFHMEPEGFRLKGTFARATHFGVTLFLTHSHVKMAGGYILPECAGVPPGL